MIVCGGAVYVSIADHVCCCCIRCFSDAIGVKTSIHPERMDEFVTLMSKFLKVRYPNCVRDDERAANHKITDDEANFTWQPLAVDVDQFATERKFVVLIFMFHASVSY